MPESQRMISSQSAWADNIDRFATRPAQALFRHGSSRSWLLRPSPHREFRPPEIPQRGSGFWDLVQIDADDAERTCLINSPGRMHLDWDSFELCVPACQIRPLWQSPSNRAFPIFAQHVIQGLSLEFLKAEAMLASADMHGEDFSIDLGTIEFWLHTRCAALTT
jgi:hypothetical protein